MFISRLAIPAHNRYRWRVTIAEILLLICLLAGVYYLLRPLQSILEGAILKLLGHNPKWVDAVIIKRDKE